MVKSQYNESILIDKGIQMNFLQAKTKAYSEITESGSNTESCFLFDEGNYYGFVIYRKKATKKDKPRMLVTVYSNQKTNENGKRLQLSKAEKTEFLRQYA